MFWPKRLESEMIKLTGVFWLVIISSGHLNYSLGTRLRRLKALNFMFSRRSLERRKSTTKVHEISLLAVSIRILLNPLSKSN